MRLKHLAIGCVVLSTAAPSPIRTIFPQSRFEGVIVFSMRPAGGKPRVVFQTTKGRKVRFDNLGGDRDPWIVDADAGRILAISHKARKVFVMTEAEMERAAVLSRGTTEGRGNGDSAVSSESTMQLDFSRAGRSETLGGIRCEVWRGWAAREGEKIKGEVCLADGVGLALPEALLSLPTLTGGNAAGPRLARYRRAFGTKGILKTSEMERGKPRVTMEAIRVERKPISDATFRSPRGYTEVAMGAELQQLQEQLRQANLRDAKREAQRTRAAPEQKDSR